MFVRKERLPSGRLPEGFLTVVPDLVVKVVSPRDNAANLERKLNEYREAGVSLIWVIYPDPRNAIVLRPLQGREELGRNGTLNGGEVLPGFSCSLVDLFAGLEAQP